MPSWLLAYVTASDDSIAKQNTSRSAFDIVIDLNIYVPLRPLPFIVLIIIHEIRYLPYCAAFSAELSIINIDFTYSLNAWAFIVVMNLTPYLYHVRITAVNTAI
jgi:hypothetical protein